jgi:hypothetical protein
VEQHVVTEINPNTGTAEAAIAYGPLQQEGYSIAVPATPQTSNYGSDNSSSFSQPSNGPDVLVMTNPFSNN